MTANINVVCITGNLTRDPELREVTGGSAVCKFRLACNTREKRDGEWTDRAHFFNVTCWGGRAKACAEHLAKGSPVAIEGRLEWREWQTRRGLEAPGGLHPRQHDPVPRRLAFLRHGEVESED